MAQCNTVKIVSREKYSAAMYKMECKITVLKRKYLNIKSS